MTNHLVGAAVVGADGNLVGVMSSQVIASDGDTNVGAAADRNYPTVTPDQGLDIALDVMVSAGYAWLPVIEGDKVVGVVAMNEIIAGYQRGCDARCVCSPERMAARSWSRRR